jgi:hypothetical protein
MSTSPGVDTPCCRCKRCTIIVLSAGFGGEWLLRFKFSG